MNPALNKQLHGLLTKSGLTTQKAALVTGFTKGRSDSSKDLSNEEAKEIIKFLSKQIDDHAEGANKMRRTIIHLAHEMHWHLTGTQKVDMQKVNDWCIKFGYCKKGLNDHTYQELTKLVTQFTSVYKSYLNKL